MKKLCIFPESLYWLEANKIIDNCTDQNSSSIINSKIITVIHIKFWQNIWLSVEHRTV